MNVQNQMSTGVMSDLFILLSRPLTMVTVTISISLGVYLDVDANHPIIHVGVVILICSLLARTLMSNGIDRWSSLIATIGLALTGLSFSSTYQQAGKVTLSSGESVESYQRGSGVAVNYHLGGTLKLVTEEKRSTLEFVGRDRVSIDNENLQPGMSIEIGDWQLALYRRSQDFKQPLTQLKLKSRANNDVSTILNLRQGQSQSPDGKTLITALNISGDRGGVNAPNLGAGVELLIKWEGQQQRGWHYVNPPNLDQQWGYSPYIIESVSVIPATIYHWNIRRSATSLPMICGLILLIFGSCLRLLKPNRLSVSA